jgi:hypothetical protein
MHPVVNVMADRFPLIVNPVSKKIEELVSGDNLNLTGNGLLTSGSTGVSGQYLKSTGTGLIWDNPGDVYLTDTQTLTNKTFTSCTLSGSTNTVSDISNNSLQNSSITINGSSISLGGSFDETDPIFTASVAFGITSTQISNWDTAYGWGDHGLEGYLTSYTETDPIFTASVAFGITSTQVSNWDTAYGWGDHGLEGYLTSYTETDPIFTASVAFGITSTQISNWDTAYGWGDHATEGYLTSYTETDPIFTASVAFGITSTQVSNWDTAYGWGDHATEGYLTSYTETSTLDDVTDRGSSTTNSLAVGGLTINNGNLTVAGNAQFGGSGGVAGVSSYADTIGILGSSGSSISQTAGIQFGDNYTGASRQWGIYNGRSATGTNVGALSFVVSSAVSTDAMSGTGSTPLTLLSSGNVGIGSTVSNEKLTVADSGSANVYIALQNSTTGTTSSDGWYLGAAGTEFQIYGKENGPITFSLNSSEKARIDTSGRLLIGTFSAPTVGVPASATFVVQGYAGVPTGDSLISLQRGQAPASISSGAQLGAITFGANDGSPYAQIHAATDGAGAANDYPGRLVFSTTADGASSPTERMRISQNGQVQVSNALDSFLILSTASAGTSNYLLAGNNNTATAIFIYSNGNIENTNNSYGSISDLKLKENIVDASSQWDDLKALQVRNYNFKEGQTHTQIGLVAQEVELVSPGLVGESPDRDAEGNDLGTVTKSVRYSVLYMKAVKALQEAMERIETLEQRLTAAGID